MTFNLKNKSRQGGDFDSAGELDFKNIFTVTENFKLRCVFRTDTNPEQAFVFGTKKHCLLIDCWRDEYFFLNHICLATNEQKTDDQ